MEKVIFPALDKILPHRAPMILIDEMVSYSETSSTTRVTIRPSTPFLEENGVPSFVGMEYMAQSIAAHGGYRAWMDGNPIQIGFLIGVLRFHTRCDYFPLGMTLAIRVDWVWGEDELMKFACILKHADTDECLQEAELNVYKPRDLQQYLRRVR